MSTSHGPHLLPSYEVERRQVGDRNVGASRYASTGRRKWRGMRCCFCSATAHPDIMERCFLARRAILGSAVTCQLVVS